MRERRRERTRATEGEDESDGGRGRERNGVLRELAAEVQLRVRAFELAHWHRCVVRMCHYSRDVLQAGGAYEPVWRYSSKAQKAESVGIERGVDGEEKY